MKAVDFDTASNIARRKVDIAYKLGAETVVSACPSCNQQFGVFTKEKAKALKDAGEKAKLKSSDICDIVASLI